MPFPLIAAGILGGTGILSGLLGSRQSKQQKKYFEQEAALRQYLRERGQKLDNLAYPLIDKTTSFFTALAEGDRDALSRYYSPAIDQLVRGYRQGQDNAYNFLSRGGAQELALTQGQLQQQGAIGRLLSGAPEVGYGNLTNIFQSLLGVGTQSSQAGSTSGLIQADLQRQQQQNQLFDSIAGAGLDFGSELYEFFNARKKAAGGSS